MRDHCCVESVFNYPKKATDALAMNGVIDVRVCALDLDGELSYLEVRRAKVYVPAKAKGWQNYEAPKPAGPKPPLTPPPPEALLNVQRELERSIAIAEA